MEIKAKNFKMRNDGEVTQAVMESDRIIDS